MEKKKLTKEIKELLDRLDVATTKYVFENYPKGEIDEDDENVRLYRAIGVLINEDDFGE